MYARCGGLEESPVCPVDPVVGNSASCRFVFESARILKATDKAIGMRSSLSIGQRSSSKGHVFTETCLPGCSSVKANGK